LRAAPPPQAGGDEAALNEAKIHFQQGVALFNDGNFNAALAEFEQTYRLRKSPGVLYNIGLTQKALFRYADAIESLQRYVAETPNMPPERKAEVEQLTSEMRALLADVTVNVEPAGATVMVDGRTMGTAPLPKALGIAAGNHVLEVVADGYKPTRRELMISAGVPLALNVKLEMIPRTGKVRITASQPLATVIIDGKNYGYAPADVELGAGGHALEVVAPKYAPGRQELVIAAGQTRTVNVQLELPPKKAPLYTKWYLWTPIAAVLAGAAIGLGVGLGTRQDPLTGTLDPGLGGVN
jgi:hypothetical protein